MSVFDLAVAPLAVVGVFAVVGGILVWRAWRDFQRDYGFD